VTLPPPPAWPLPEAPFVTADLPGTGGVIKQQPEDFFVDEQPLYQPSGEGEHIYLFVEKRGLSTLRAARIIARHFGVHVTAVGFAGLKDKRAVTRQAFSVHVPGKKPEDFPMMQHEHMGVLWVDLHTNKLRRGHLAGNRFSIKIRGTEMSKAPMAAKILARLEKYGSPNLIGDQRFGYLKRNHLIGRAMVLGDNGAVLEALLAPDDGSRDSQAEARRAYTRGDYRSALELFYRESRTERRVLGELARGASPSRAVRSIERGETEFFLTAFQSAIFNAVLATRITSGTLGSLEAGDIAFKHDNRACFDVTTESLGPDLQGRLDRLEVSPSGPMWGAEMKLATGLTGEAERVALAACGVSLETLQAFQERRRGRLTGERRPLRVPITDPDVEGGSDERGNYIRVAFDLPRGAFATSVVREITKQVIEPAAPESQDEESEPEPDE
jgi:tRNA pseudouridine13 synthase